MGKMRSARLGPCGRLDNFHDAVYVVVEALAPPEQFLFLLRRGHDPARVDAQAEYSGLRDEKLDPSGAHL